MSAQTIEPASVSPSPWLYGPKVDLLVGCGLGYVLLTPVLIAYGKATGTVHWPFLFFAAVTTFISAPHYGATVLRAYSDADDRKKYRFFILHATLALAVLMAGASRSVWLSSALITAYITWSPWHFAGQNYGIALMFLRRRDVEVDATTKRYFYFSFLTSALLAMIAIHARGGDFSLSLASVSAPGVPILFSLSIPPDIAVWMFAGVGSLYVASTVSAVWRLREGRGFQDLVPALTLVATQSLWFAVPSLFANASPSLVFASVWVSGAHGIQYLWINAYYDGRRGTSDAGAKAAGPFLVKALLAGSAVTILPGLLFAPDLLGSRPWDAGLAMTAFSIINLHHFILDGAIWKLRDGRIAEVLLRAASDVGATPIPRPAAPWLKRIGWAAAALCLAVPLVSSYVTFVALPRAETPQDIDRAADALRWVGRDTASTRLELGQTLYEGGFLDAAEVQLRRSIELFPMARNWVALGLIQRDREDWEGALASFDAAIAIKPDLASFHVRRARMLLELDDSSEGASPMTRQAGVSLLKALEIEPGHAVAAVMLSRIQASSDQIGKAKFTIENALVAEKDPARVRALRQRLREIEFAERNAENQDEDEDW